MNQKNYVLPSNIEGQIYRDLLSFSAGYCDKFILVLRDTVGLNKNAIKAVKMLSPFLVSTSEKSSWGGTILLTGTATVNEYKFSNDSLELILALSNDLYDWVQPNLPEDLGLIRDDNSPFLSSVTHDLEAVLTLSSSEIDLLEKNIPKLEIKVLED
jgi:hypothetical protein